jgi:hypothetical protein
MLIKSKIIFVICKFSKQTYHECFIVALICAAELTGASFNFFYHYWRCKMQRKPNNKQLDSKKQIFSRIITIVISLITVCMCILTINFPTLQSQFVGRNFGEMVASAQTSCSGKISIRHSNDNGDSAKDTLYCAKVGTQLEINPTPNSKRYRKVNKIILKDGWVERECVQPQNGNIYTTKEC